MKIGILGVGNIGATLAQRLSRAGHDIQVANSRGPETIPTDVTSAGAQAVHADRVADGVDALILSIPFSRIPDIAPLVTGLPQSTVVLDTSNYYPRRDGRILPRDGQVESHWVAEQLGGRPLVKAWNAITTNSFIDLAAEPGSVGRVAIPVAADSDEDRAVGMALVEDTGFTGHDAGVLADSWRQQPGTPAYCTDLGPEDLRAALAAAVPGRGPVRRDLAVEVIEELSESDPAVLGRDFIVRVNRLLYI